VEGQVPMFIFSRHRVSQLYSLALIYLYVATYDSQGYGGGILTHLPVTGAYYFVYPDKQPNIEAALILSGIHCVYGTCIQISNKRNGFPPFKAACTYFVVIPFHLQSVPVHSTSCVKCIQLHIEKCSVALLCN
jgi:hypothetical protein